jgi:sugar phosphate isomerase/epimerase
MKIGMITDSLPDADFDTMLDVAARLEMDALEFGCGNWSSAPHIDLDRMLESAAARREFSDRLADRVHGYQNVYNVATLQRLRAATGETVGANLDPSHLMWMGADPLAAARALGDAVYYVHAKDTRIDPTNAGVNGVIDTTPGSEYRLRAWNYITLGQGHDEAWWRAFVTTLSDVGYDGVLSIEHEDPAMSAVAGVEQSVELLRRVIVDRPQGPHASA